jgi:hypothetical protein
MSWILQLLGMAGAGKTISEPVEAVGNVLDKLFTSKDEKLSHEEIRMRLMMKPDIAQVELNKVEAQHRSIFVAGWRPFIGWVCGYALLYNFIVRDIAAWIITLIYPLIEGVPQVEAPPELAMTHLMTVLMGMLGLGGMRTYEKLKGVAK